MQMSPWGNAAQFLVGCCHEAAEDPEEATGTRSDLSLYLDPQTKMVPHKETYVLYL